MIDPHVSELIEVGLLHEVGWFWRYNANEGFGRKEPSQWWFTKKEPTPEFCEMWDCQAEPAYRGGP